MDVGGVHTCFEQATFSVDQNVAFATRDLLAAVVAARTAGLGGADGLAVDDGCCGLRLAANGEAVLLTQRRVDPLPSAAPTPLGIMVEHRCPRRKVVRQGAPLTSGAEQVEHGLDDAAQCEDLWMSRLLARAKQRCKDLPFRVAQVGSVRTRCHASDMGSRSLLCAAANRGRHATKLLSSLSLRLRHSAAPCSLRARMPSSRHASGT